MDRLQAVMDQVRAMGSQGRLRAPNYNLLAQPQAQTPDPSQYANLLRAPRQYNMQPTATPAPPNAFGNRAAMSAPANGMQSVGAPTTAPNMQAPTQPGAPGGYVPGSTVSDEDLTAINSALPPGIAPRTKADIEEERFGKDKANAMAYAGSIAQGGALPDHVQASLQRLAAAGIPMPGAS